MSLVIKIAFRKVIKSSGKMYEDKTDYTRKYETENGLTV